MSLYLNEYKIPLESIYRYSFQPFIKTNSKYHLLFKPTCLEESILPLNYYIAKWNFFHTVGVANLTTDLTHSDGIFYASGNFLFDRSLVSHTFAINKQLNIFPKLFKFLYIYHKYRNITMVKHLNFYLVGHKLTKKWKIFSRKSIKYGITCFNQRKNKFKNILRPAYRQLLVSNFFFFPKTKYKYTLKYERLKKIKKDKKTWWKRYKKVYRKMCINIFSKFSTVYNYKQYLYHLHKSNFNTITKNINIFLNEKNRFKTLIPKSTYKYFISEYTIPVLHVYDLDRYEIYMELTNNKDFIHYYYKMRFIYGKCKWRLKKLKKRYLKYKLYIEARNIFKALSLINFSDINNNYVGLKELLTYKRKVHKIKSINPLKEILFCLDLETLMLKIKKFNTKHIIYKK